MSFRNAKRLALGTVQFGLPYGVANQQGQVSPAEAAAIVATAADAGLDTLDTAISYGDSESVLGHIGVKRWSVVSKLPAIPDSAPDITQWVNAQLHASLDRLQIEKLNGTLLHRPEQLLKTRGAAIYEALLDAKAAGLTQKIGVSVYDPAELNALWSTYGGFDLVQAPLNILDRRLITSGWLQKLQAEGVELHTRSAFLQGLLLMPAAARPAHFSRWGELLKRWDAWLTDNNADALEACIAYPLSLDAVSKVVVGVDSVAQLNEILRAAAPGTARDIPDEFECDDSQLINPAMWPST